MAAQTVCTPACYLRYLHSVGSGEAEQIDALLEYTKRQFEQRDIPCLPDGIRLCQDLDIPVKTVYTKSEFLRLAAHGSYGVISFWTGKVMASSIHTVAYSVDANRRISVYNRYNNTDKVYTFDTMQEAFGQYSFIVANIM